MEINGTVQTTNAIDGTVASARQISGTTNHSAIRWVDGEEVAELIEPVVREVIEGMSLDSDVVLNASNVEGSTVTAALNKLAEGVTPTSLTTDDITNLSDIEGTNVTNALNSIDTILDKNDTDIEHLKTNKADKSEIPNIPEWALAENKPSYTSDEITNSSDVSGTTVSGALNQLNQNLSAIWSIVYPVGSIYMSVNNVSPSTLFGGTWEALEDRFLLGASSTYSAGTTGGSASHTITNSEMPSHTHTQQGSFTSGNQSANPSVTGGTCTITSSGAHTHNIDANTIALGSSWGGGSAFTTYSSQSSTMTITGNTAKGSTGTHTHTVPNHTHTVSGNHTHSTTISGETKSSGSGNAMSIMNPYLSVYMWKRTA